MPIEAELKAKKEAETMLEREKALDDYLSDFDSLMSLYLMSYGNTNLLHEYNEVRGNLVQFITKAKHQARYGNPMVTTPPSQTCSKNETED